MQFSIHMCTIFPNTNQLMVKLFLAQHFTINFREAAGACGKAQ